MKVLRQNTAIKITVGPFLDKGDGITPELSLTVTSCHLTMTKDDDDDSAVNLIIDADLTASGGDNDMVHVTDDNAGYYSLELTAAQTNYLGRVSISINDVATHCPVFHEAVIISQGLFDLLFGAFSATRGLAGTALPDAAADAAGGLPTTTKITDARLGALTDWIDAGRLDLLLDAVKAKTDLLNFHGTGATAYVKSDIIEINDVAASAATEINANLTKIIGTALTEAIAGQLAAAFKKFFDVTTPTGSVNSLPNAAPDAAGGLPISDTGGVDVDVMETTIAKVETLIGTVV